MANTENKRSNNRRANNAAANAQPQPTPQDQERANRERECLAKRGFSLSNFVTGAKFTVTDYGCDEIDNGDGTFVTYPVIRTTIGSLSVKKMLRDIPVAPYEDTNGKKQSFISHSGSFIDLIKQVLVDLPSSDNDRDTQLREIVDRCGNRECTIVNRTNFVGLRPWQVERRLVINIADAK